MNGESDRLPAPGVQLKDTMGLWTGKRRYQVTLRPKPDCPGEFLHLPESFAIEANQGFLWYPGQTQVCRRCGLSGHTKAACGREQCCFCWERVTCFKSVWDTC